MPIDLFGEVYDVAPGTKWREGNKRWVICLNCHEMKIFHGNLMCKACNSRQWFDEHPGYREAYNAKWNAEHPEYASVKSKEWKVNNPDRVIAYNKQYRSEHLEEGRVYSSVRYHTIGRSYKKHKHMLKAMHNNVCALQLADECKERGGVVLDDNWAIDHKWPISKRDEYWGDDIHNPVNLQWCCRECNSVKKDKIIGFQYY